MAVYVIKECPWSVSEPPVNVLTLGYAERILEENEINLGAATSRIMDADMAYESTKMARQNVLVQAAASMVTQANSLNNVVLSLLQ